MNCGNKLTNPTLVFNGIFVVHGDEILDPLRIEVLLQSQFTPVSDTQGIPVHNLVFVRSSRSCIDAIKESRSATIPIRYIMDREYHRPIIVPDSQMRNFMAVSANYDESLLYFEPSELNIRKGTRVRITGGLFEGVEGEFVRVRNDRRVVVTIEGVMAVATTFVHPSLVEPVTEK